MYEHACTPRCSCYHTRATPGFDPVHPTRITLLHLHPTICGEKRKKRVFSSRVAKVLDVVGPLQAARQEPSEGPDQRRHQSDPGSFVGRQQTTDGKMDHKKKTNAARDHYGRQKQEARECKLVSEAAVCMVDCLAGVIYLELVTASTREGGETHGACTERLL